MKTNIKKLTSLTVTLMLAILAAACTPKQRTRQVHEGAKDWSVKTKSVEALGLQSVDFSKLNLEEIEELITSASTYEKSILEPLGRYVLDAQFVSTPSNRNRRLEKAIEIFNKTLFKSLTSDGILTDAAKIEWLRRFENTVFANCTPDLKSGCVNEKLFGGDAYTAQIITLLAIKDDAKLDEEIKTQGAAKNCVEKSESCRGLIDIRYRRLAMAFSLKRTNLGDDRLNFAFMKYIRLLDNLIAHGGDLGYITKTYGSIFETLIQRYKPKNVKSPEFRQFIENFNPWTYSGKRSDVFRHGSKEMLDLATQCCMYSDEGQFKLSKSMIEGIKESQAEIASADLKADDKLNPTLSFHSMVTTLLARAKGKDAVKTADILSNLGLSSDLNRLSDLNSNFYNEYFFIIDRLFKEHLDTSEALRILERTDATRARSQLLPIVKLYMRVQLAYLTVDTIDFMNKLYNSNISSNMIFSEAITVSRDISIRWMKVQGRLDLLNTFTGSYFKKLTVMPTEFNETADLLRSVNRNIHYLSVYPNMIGMTYFLAKNQGVVKGRSWWGREFEIKPETVVSDLFDGKGDSVQDVWFRFSNTPVLISRERLFYAFHYALKTQALETFTVDEKVAGQSDRAKFFEITLGKYLEQEKRDLEKRFMELERTVTKNNGFQHLGQICKYELSAPGTVAAPAAINIDFMDLGKRTYTGFGDGTQFGLMKTLFSAQGQGAIRNMFQTIEPKLTFVRALIALLENHMNESGEMKSNPEAAKKELEAVNQVVGNIESRQRQYLTSFFKYRKNMYDCAKQMYKVEMMRSYRVQDEERNHLGRIYDMIKTVQGLKTVAEQNKKLEELNKLHFGKNIVKFDRLLGDGYVMSRYDFLMRVRDRIEKDIFAQPTERERKVYGSELSTLIKRRSVRVEMPAGLERLDIYTSETPETLHITDTKEEFVNQGIKLFSGGAGSFAEWQMQGDQLEVFVSYLYTLVDLFLMGDVRTNGAEYGACTGEACNNYVERISATEVLETFRGIVELVDLNDFDVENAKAMGLDGRVKTENLEKFIIEETSLKAEPLLRKLMTYIYDRTGIGGEFDGILKSGKSLSDMLTDEKVVIFDLGSEFKDGLARVYGAPILRIANRAQELFNAMPALEKNPEWTKLYNTRLRIDESGEVIDIKGSRGRDDLKIVDSVKFNNLLIDRMNFTSKTDNMFKTDNSAKK